MARPQQPYHAVGINIWAAPQLVEYMNSHRALRLGFPLATVNEDLTDPEACARQITAALNLFEAAAVIDQQLHQVQLLVDDLTRRIDQHTHLNDHTLLVTVPIHLADLRSRLQRALIEAAGEAATAPAPQPELPLAQAPA